MPDSFARALKNRMRFESRDLGLCAHGSWFGVCKKARLGIEELWLYYGRRAALLSPNLLTFRVERSSGSTERAKTRRDHPLHIDEDDGRGIRGRIEFAGRDILCYHLFAGPKVDATLRATFLLPATEPRFARGVAFNARSRGLTITTRLPATDARDPDPDHPITICLTVAEPFSVTTVITDGSEAPLSGESFETRTDGAVVVNFATSLGPDATRADSAGECGAFVLGIGEGPSADRIAARMPRAGQLDAAKTKTASEQWLRGALDTLCIESLPRGHRADAASAVYHILANSKAPLGQIGRNAVFPARGAYSAHYQLDACLAAHCLGRFNERLASDYLLTVCENQERDGKMPRFVSPTWNGPGGSAPPILGWAVWSLYQRYANKELIRDVYEPLCRMVDWWFESRDSDGDGLIEYLDSVESGWEGSPRFDRGRIAAVDLNAFINREMRVLALMAPIIGRESDVEAWEDRVVDHTTQMHQRLFDRDDCLFRDRLVEEDRLTKVLTPASFVPLWAGVKVSSHVAHETIARYLINPKHFFGSRPFPTIAYSDPRFQSERPWHGALCPSVAWMMTETLRAWGFEREWKESTRRLVELLTHHHDPAEHYSATGRPLGVPAWTASCAALVELMAQS